jgi:hypothetical protein
MKHIGTKLSMLVLAGSLAGSAMAANDDIPVKAAAGENYCYMKFPAMTQKSLATKHPQLKSGQTGDVIDYSGPCDETPTGKDQVQEQKRQESFMFGRAYEDGD